MPLQHVLAGGMGVHPHVAKRYALRGNRRAYSSTKATTAGNMPLRARGVLQSHLADVGPGGLQSHLAPCKTNCHALNGQVFGAGYRAQGRRKRSAPPETGAGLLFLDTCN